MPTLTVPSTLGKAALDYTGLGVGKAAQVHFEAVLEMDANHVGVMTHKQFKL